MKNICVYPGSFDPVTCGHYDIIKRISKLFDKVYVAVLSNSEKKCMFTVSDRINMIEKAKEDMSNVHVDAFDGLLVDYLKKVDADIVIRGMRNTADFDMEQQMAVVNKKLFPPCETIMFFASGDTRHISSSLIRELIKNKADISKFVPETVNDIIRGLSYENL